MGKSKQYYHELISLFKGVNINNGVPKFLLENTLAEYLKKYHRIPIERTSYEGKDYPELTILDRTRNIFGYIVLYTSRSNLSSDKLAKQVQLIYSELDRPVFYVYWNTHPKAQEIRFATSDQVHDLLLQQMAQTSNVETAFPSQDDMGTFAELIDLFKRNI